MPADGSGARQKATALPSAPGGACARVACRWHLTAVPFRGGATKAGRELGPAPPLGLA